MNRCWKPQWRSQLLITLALARALTTTGVMPIQLVVLSLVGITRALSTTLHPLQISTLRSPRLASRSSQEPLIRQGRDAGQAIIFTRRRAMDMRVRHTQQEMHLFMLWGRCRLVPSYQVDRADQALPANRLTSTPSDPIRVISPQVQADHHQMGCRSLKNWRRPRMIHL
jgi:hypothetical protein